MISIGLRTWGNSVQWAPRAMISSFFLIHKGTGCCGIFLNALFSFCFFYFSLCVCVCLCRDEDILLLTDCLQMEFSPVQRDHLFLMFRREILILDLAINCTVGSIMAEKSTSSFSQLCPCWQRDVLYILHENGCCSFRMKDRLRAPPSLPTSPGTFAQRDETYITYAFSDPIRLGRSAQVRLKLLKECASLQPTLV